MIISIVVYSQTGNTYSVAERLKEKLLTKGHKANIEKIISVDSKQTDVNKIRIEKLPDLGPCEMVVFCSPVQAFSLAPVMKAYMAQISSIKNKKVFCFVTQSFPYPWMGGNNAIKKMIKACESKGATVLDTGIVNWSNKNREKQISELIDKFSTM